MKGWLLAGMLALAARGQDLPRGRVIEDVKCAGNPSQSYALYLPSNYSDERQWSVIFAFDPRARGRAAVEPFLAAAEKYGYIVAGSNNSRNGSWQASLVAADAMAVDVSSRFAIAPRRVYTAGLSGGARVAMGVALSGKIAGVIASSAGFPDAQPRKSASFAIFGTAGTEDFNYLEMRQLDRALTTPHRVAIFEGGHTWLPSELAVDAIEWLEIQAMKSDRRERDQPLIDRLFAKRQEHAAALTNEKDAAVALKALAADFKGLKDVTAFTARAVELRRKKSVQDAFKKDRAAQDREEGLVREIGALEGGLTDPDRRALSLGQLRRSLTNLARQSNAPEDSPERRMARRVLRGTLVGGAERFPDVDYRKLLEEVRSAAGSPFGRNP